MSIDIHSYIETLNNEAWETAEAKDYTNHTYVTDLALLGDTFGNTSTVKSPLHHRDENAWAEINSHIDNIDPTRHNHEEDTDYIFGNRWATIAELATTPNLPNYIHKTITEITNHYPSHTPETIRVVFGYSA